MLEWLCMLCHMFILLSYCASMLVAYFTPRTSICCLDCLAFSPLPNGWTRMPKEHLAMNSLQRQRRGEIRWRRRRPATGGGWRRGDDPETLEAERAISRAKGFGGISKFLPVTIYSPTMSVWPSGTTRWHRDAESQAVTATRCDRMVLIGCTEIENLDQFSELRLT